MAVDPRGHRRGATAGDRSTTAGGGDAGRHPDDRATGRRHLRHGRAAPRRRVPDGARRHARRRARGWSDGQLGRLGRRVGDRLPGFIAAVVLLSFVLLTMVFRSVLVALKAALLNLLSIGAAYGVLVMVFQWGWGEGLIGLESTVPIVSFIPMFMFAVLFGLSMDYEVFLLSRCPRGVPGDWRQRPFGDRRDRSHRTGDHLGGADHDLRVRRLRAGRRSGHQDARPRPRDGDLRRRHRRPRRAGAGHDEAAGRRQLVAAGLARPAPAPRRHRRRDGPARTGDGSPCRRRARAGCLSTARTTATTSTTSWVSAGEAVVDGRDWE